MKAAIRKQLLNLTQDLLNLEVVTIVKPNITGRKMPSPDLALADICRKYNIKLAALGKGVEQKDGVEWGKRQAFKKIGEYSEDLIEKLKQDLGTLQKQEKELLADRESDLWMLYRIKTTCQALKNILPKEDGEKPEFSTDHLVLIRKAWELGIEEIAMKTVVQLDGDVITRVQSNYATEAYAAVHKLHNTGISTSLAFWEMLADIAKALVQSFFKLK